MSNSIFAEKYRPQALDDVIGQEHIVPYLKEFVKNRDIPHMLFSGKAGTGKTTCAIALAKEMYGKSWKNYFIEMNASDETGVDTIRGKVKDYVRASIIGEDYKIIFFDEMDYLCLSKDTKLITGWNTNQKITNIENIPTDRYISIPSLNLKTGKIERDKGKRVISGEKELFEVELEDGRKIKCSKNHKFFIKNNGKIVEKKLSELKKGDKIVDCFDKLNIKRCEVCGKITDNKRFCSIECQDKAHSIDMKGKNNPMFGKTWKHSKETLKKISDANKGKKNPNYGGKWYGETFWHIATEEQKQKLKDKFSKMRKGKTFREIYGKEREVEERAKRHVNSTKEKIVTDIWIEEKLSEEFINCEYCRRKIKTYGKDKDSVYIHHIDENHNNHTIKNIMFVCPYCHNLKIHDAKSNFLEKGWKITHKKKVIH